MERPTKNPFDTIAKLQARGIRVFVVGGYAVNGHGFSRMTQDSDCLIVASDLPKADDIFREDGFIKVRQLPSHARFYNASFFPPLVDILLVNESTFEKMWSERVPCEYHGHALQIPHLEHLIAMKLHAIRNQPDRHSKDLLDIHELMKVNPGVISRDRLVELCHQFGPSAKTELMIEMILSHEQG
jgi:hypothetical protein